MPAAIPVVAGLAGAALSVKGAKDAAKSQADAIAAANKQDPRIEQMLYGTNNNGLLDRFYRQMDQGPSAAANQYASDSGNYLSQYGGTDMGAARDAAYKAMGGNAAPMAQAAQMTGTQAQGVSTDAVGSGLNAYAKGNMVNAPSQNNINLTPTFQGLLGGGDTSKLMASLDAGNALAGAQFRQNQSDLTDNLQRNIMPGIRSNSVLAGQYGGSRQGVAEGLAISDLTKQLNNSNTQFGLGATAASSSALANAYESGQNRSLAAAQGLSGQQYQTAFKDADTKNAAEFMNVGNVYDLGKFNAGLQQQTNQFNANNALQNNQFNANLGQQTNQNNAGLQQQTNLANQGAQLSTNAQNNAGRLAGAGLLSGLTGQAQNAVNASDNYELNRMAQVGGLLQPYLSKSPVPQQVAPAANSGAAALGGGLAGLSLGNSLAGMFGNQTSFAGPGPFAGPSAGPGIMGAFPAGGY